jgi:hypothetical protein
VRRSGDSETRTAIRRGEAVGTIRKVLSKRFGTSSGSLPVSVLESIVRDETDDEFRSSVLESLFALDEEKGRSAAEACKERTGLLESAAKKLILVKDQQKFGIEYRRKICYPGD